MERIENKEVKRENKAYLVNEFKHKRRETGQGSKLTVLINSSGTIGDVIIFEI